MIQTSKIIVKENLEKGNVHDKWVGWIYFQTKLFFKRIFVTGFSRGRTMLKPGSQWEKQQLSARWWNISFRASKRQWQMDPPASDPATGFIIVFFLLLSLHVLRVLLIYTTFQFSNFYQIEPEFSSIGTSSTVFTKMGMVSYYYNDDLIIVIEFWV